MIKMNEFGESSYRRILRGDKNALYALIHEYSDALVRFAYGYVKDTAAAEDIMEESFATLFLKPRKIGNEAHLRAYLYKVTRSKCLDYLRRQRRHVPLEDVENILQVPGAEADYMRRERNRTLYLCMGALPEQYRHVLELSYFDCFSVDEICYVTGKNQKQVYNLLSRARLALKERLQKEGITHEDL